MALTLLSACPVAYTVLRKPGAELDGVFGTGWTAKMAFKVDAADAYAFCAYAAGTPQTITRGGRSVSVSVPMSHPDIPQLLCTKINCKFMGGFDTRGSTTAARNQWNWSAIACEFTSVPYLIDGSTPFMTVETEVGAEAYTLAGKKLAFPDGTPIQADAAVTVPTIVYSHTIYLSTALDDTDVQTYAGKVNSVAMTLGDTACAIGTLRFDGMRASEATSANFSKSYTRNLKATWRALPWNQCLKNDGTWDTPTGPGGATIYSAADFSGLYT